MPRGLSRARESGRTRWHAPRWGNSGKAAPFLRAERLLSFAAACVFAVVMLEAFWIVLTIVPLPTESYRLGMDYVFYRDVGARWLADGSFYLPRQLEGPYVAELMVDVLYPPNALYLFVPFALLPGVLSTFAWWAAPIGVSLYVLRWLQPKPWALLGMAVLFVWPQSIAAFLFGNTNIWAVACLFAGIRWGWPAALLVLKPTLAPFCLVFVRRRAFWIGLAVLGLVSLPLLPPWLDYVTAMRGAVIPLSYSFGVLPLLLVPMVAWAGRSGPSDRQRWLSTKVADGGSAA